jgi:Flp pilus assembly protein TadG
MTGILQRFRRDQRGVAAIELALVGGLFILGGMSAVEVGRYAYETSEVNAAAQAGAQAAAVACDLDHTPATVNCPGLNSAVTTAIQSTQLGSQVTLSGAIKEAYYCLDGANTLQYAGAIGAAPADCSGVANTAATAQPTIYLQVKVAAPFQSLFPGLTIAQSFAASIKRTAWMRMA